MDWGEQLGQTQSAKKPKGGRNLDNGAEVSGGVEGGTDMIARKEFQCE